MNSEAKNKAISAFTALLNDKPWQAVDALEGVSPQDVLWIKYQAERLASISEDRLGKVR